jgi:hypothetical protein
MHHLCMAAAQRFSMIRPISFPPPVPISLVFDLAARANAQRQPLPMARRPRLALVTPAPPVASDLARDDWNLLFDTVMNRLSRIAAEPGCEPAAQRLPDATRRLRNDVRECVAALGQLHAWQLDEAGRNARLELAYLDLRWSLAWPRSDPEATPHAD